jgi:protein-disulfide isomerase
MRALRPRTLAEPVSLDDHAWGRYDARVTLVEYGDYECRDTRRMQPSIRTLLREFGDRLLFVFRHFPQPDLHPHARSAGTAAEAAAAQGAFWRMHEYLLGQQGALEPTVLRRYVTASGLDAERFDFDRTSAYTTARIERDLASGRRSGVSGTPTFYINGRRHDGPHGVELVRAIVTVASH